MHKHQRILRVLLSTHLRKDLDEVLHYVLCRLAQWNVLNDQNHLEVRVSTNVTFLGFESTLIPSNFAAARLSASSYRSRFFRLYSSYASFV